MLLCRMLCVRERVSLCRTRTGVCTRHTVKLRTSVHAALQPRMLLFTLLHTLLRTRTYPATHTCASLADLAGKSSLMPPTTSTATAAAAGVATTTPGSKSHIAKSHQCEELQCAAARPRDKSTRAGRAARRLVPASEHSTVSAYRSQDTVLTSSCTAVACAVALWRCPLPVFASRTSLHQLRGPQSCHQKQQHRIQIRRQCSGGERCDVEGERKTLLSATP